MIRISKILFINPAKVWISGIECNYDNIIKITDVFDLKYIILGIDSLAEDSSLLKFIKEEDLKYCIKKDSAYFEMYVEVPYNLFKCILREAVNEDPENIFVLNLLAMQIGRICCMDLWKDWLLRELQIHLYQLEETKEASWYLLIKIYYPPEKHIKRFGRCSLSKFFSI